MPLVNRRSFLGSAAAATLGVASAQPAIPIVDTHIHLFDPTRPQGIPWPPKENAVLYKPALPERYRKIAEPLGIKAAIMVECSPWVEDNQWVLDVMAKDPIMVGMIGNLEPGKTGYRAQLDRFRKSPMFLGIRYGNLWGRSLADELGKPGFVPDLQALADAGLVMDSANPNAALIAALLKTSDRVPKLRIVVDHLPQATPPAEGAALKAYEADLKELGSRPQVYVKVSEVLRRVDGKVRTDLAFYKDRLDHITGIFGEDRVIYGSDWPNSDSWAEYPQVLTIVRQYFQQKSRAAQEKYFWKNSVAAYRWKKRAASQPQLG